MLFASREHTRLRARNKYTVHFAQLFGLFSETVEVDSYRQSAPFFWQSPNLQVHVVRWPSDVSVVHPLLLQSLNAHVVRDRPEGDSVVHPFFVQSLKLQVVRVSAPPLTLVVHPFFVQSPKLQRESDRAPPGASVLHPFFRQSPNAHRDRTCSPSGVELVHPFVEQLPKSH